MKKCSLTVEYSKNKFKDETVEKFIENYMETLEVILDNKRLVCYLWAWEGF